MMKWWTQYAERWATLRGKPALDSLLANTRPDQPLADRIDWAEDILGWIRRDLPAARFKLLLQLLDRQPEVRQRVAQTLRSLIRDTQALDLFADTGLSQGTGFIHELGSRLTAGLLPDSPDTRDLADVFDRLFPHETDATWLEQLDAELAARIIALFHQDETPEEAGWASLKADMEDAMVQLADRIRVIGCQREIRSRMTKSVFRDLPFQKLGPALTALLERKNAGTPIRELAAELNLVRTRAEACDRCVDEVVACLEKSGVHTALVYDIERLRAQVRRLELLLDAWSAPPGDVQRTMSVLADLVRENHERRSAVALCRQNLHLITRRIVERNAETGDHYVARNGPEYTSMLKSAMGGGAITGLTTVIKLVLATFAMAGFIKGAAFGLNYAISFVAIQIFGFTLATKQPANTAPALARRMAELRKPAHLEALVDEVVFLIRSQIAAVFGNLVAVIPATLAIDFLWVQVFGHHLANTHKAETILESMSPMSACWIYAVFTGILLWLSSMIAAWADNRFVLHRLGPMITQHRRMQRLLGPTTTRRIAQWLERNMAGLAGNISLGLLLGLAPEFATFLGLPLDVRHVTLSTGQVSAAFASLGIDHLYSQTALWTVVGVLGVGVLNIAVSFGLALTVAMRARNVKGPERKIFYRALGGRMLKSPLSFILPVGVVSSNGHAVQKET
ncbi:MAG TPA: site-specific recombinase [Candidatus Limnocylindria bacterium]|nr:site-specific recombinase [Candidatus Limnocylindria bacterium]